MLLQTIAQRAGLRVPRSTEIEVLAAAVLVFAGFGIAIATGIRYPVALIIVPLFCSICLLRWMWRLNSAAHASRALSLFGICFCIGIAAAHAIDLADLLTPRSGEGYLVAAVAVVIPGALWLTYILRRSQALPHVWAWTIVVPIVWLAFGLPGLDFRFFDDEWLIAARWHSSVSEELALFAMVALVCIQRRTRFSTPLSAQSVLLLGAAVAGSAFFYTRYGGFPAIGYVLCSLPLAMLIRKSGPRRSRCFDVRGLPAGLAGGSIVMLVAMPDELGNIVPVPEFLAVIALIFGIVVWVRLTPAERLWARVCLLACGPLATAALVGFLFPQFMMYVGFATQDARAADALESIENHWSIVPVALYEQALMKDEYLWADAPPPPVVVEHFGHPKTVADLPWSGVMSNREANERFSSTRTGFGLIFPERSDNEAIVAYAYPGSPAERAGLHRGDRIVAMNGKLGPGYTVADAFRRTRFSERATFQIETRTGETRELTLERKDYKAGPVVLERVLPGGDAPVGYLVLGNFHGSIQEIDRALAKFRNSGVRDLVLDLRWNPGGSTYLASQLVQSLAGRRTPADGAIRSVIARGTATWTTTSLLGTKRRRHFQCGGWP